MPSDQFNVVTSKFSNVIPSRAATWKDSYYWGCLDIFIEIITWDWLKEKYPGLSVRFKTTPDLVAEDEGRVVRAAAECKNFHTSDRERQRWEKDNSISGSITLDEDTMPDDISRNPFLKKVRSTLDNAKGQLGKTGLTNNMFISLNFVLDTPYWTPPLKPYVERLIRDESKKLSATGITLLAFEGYDFNRTLT